MDGLSGGLDVRSLATRRILEKGDITGIEDVRYDNIELDVTTHIDLAVVLLPPRVVGILDWFFEVGAGSRGRLFEG